MITGKVTKDYEKCAPRLPSMINLESREKKSSAMKFRRINDRIGIKAKIILTDGKPHLIKVIKSVTSFVQQIV